ncbi:hypothetical protein AABB24_001441 [Solanum stoloniferum]
MVYELGWNWNDLHLLAQGSLAGHLLECGCQLTGGYYMHPGDKYRDISLQDLLDLSLPFAEVSFDGKVCVAKAESSGGVLNPCTCAEQLLYEVGNPSSYITPDVVVDFQDVSFQTLSSSKVLCAGAKPSASAPNNLLLLASKDKGWKGWGEISYGGYECVKRAKAADFLVRSWMEEVYPGISKHLISYIIGLDSLKAVSIDEDLPRDSQDIRLRMDGLFENKEQAIHFTKEFIALYTNGPAGGGGIRSYSYHYCDIFQKIVEMKTASKFPGAAEVEPEFLVYWFWITILFAYCVLNRLFVHIKCILIQLQGLSLSYWILPNPWQALWLRHCWCLKFSLLYSFINS